MIMERITEAMLQRKVDYLNKILDRPAAPWSRTPTGNKANIGNIHLSGAYGGWCLHEMANDGGGVNHLRGMETGYVSKRELFNRLCSFIGGIEVTK